MTSITLTSTFTIDPAKPTIDYWLSKFLKEFDVNIYQYNRVFDHILTASNSQNHFSIVIVRFEDFFKEKIKDNNFTDTQLQEAKENLTLMIDKICEQSIDSKRQSIVVFAPSSNDLSKHIKLFENELCKKIHDSSTVKTISSDYILNFFKIDSFFDEYTQDAAHMPFSQEGYIAIGTAISRQLYAFLSKPKKVIVSDCDNTLWQGVCAEDGPLGVIITPAHKQLQLFLKEESDNGKLICLASKNIETDVWRVFDENPDMILKKSDILYAQINWDPKYENIKKISQSLDLATNSFLFIDDNLVEVAEMSMNAPDVAIWHISTNADELCEQMKNIWELDILSITDADLERKNFYHTNKTRENYKNQFDNMSDFLSFLDVKSYVEEIKEEHVSRCSQITYRTNQFNTHQGLYNENQFQQILNDREYIIRMMRVDDKFGSYGLVGLCIAHIENKTLIVKDFYMSCRVLNRLAEFHLLESIVQEGFKHGAQKITFECSPTERNQYAQAFIAKLNIAFNDINHNTLIFQCDIAKLISYNWNLLLNVQVNLSCALPAIPKKKNTIEHLASSTIKLMNIQTLTNAIFPKNYAPSPSLPIQNEQEMIISVFKDFLEVDEVNENTDFFKSGGSSFSAVMVMSKLCHYLKVNIPLVAIYYNPTPQELYLEFTKNMQGENPIIYVENQDKNKTPLILIHPAGGSSHPYIPLTQYMKDRPIYFLNDPFAYSQTDHFENLNSMCLKYADVITKNCKNSSIYLGGWSFGGMVTLTLSNLLEKEGITVKSLLLIDTYNPKSFSKEAAKLKQENLLSNGQGSNNDMIDLILKRYQSYMNDFIPTTIDLPCVLFKCKSQGYVDSELFNSTTNGWEKEMIYDLEKIEVDGEHDSLFNHENIEKFSKKLNYYLEQHDER